MQLDRVGPVGLPIVGEEGIPVAIFHNSALSQDRLSARDRPAHARLFHAVFDERSACAFDCPCSNGVAFLEIAVGVPPMSVVLEVGDGFLQHLLLRVGEEVLGFGQPLA